MGYVGQAPAAGSVTTSDITDGTIANADIASDAAIAMSKTALSAGTNITLSTNTLNVDDAFIKNDASDATTGVLTVSNSTAASATNTGAFVVTGGIATGGDIWVGDDIVMDSDSAVLSLGDGQDVTLTHDGTTGATLAGNPLELDSGGTVTLDSASGIFIFQDGSTEVLRFTEGNSGDVTVKLAVNGKDLIFTDNGDATNMKILDAAAGINVPGEVQTTGIGYTDGDNAMTIADGGGVTFATHAYIADDKKLYFGAAPDASIEYDEDGTDQLRITGNTVFENQIEATLDIEIDSTPSDETVSGITATFTAGEALVRGEVCYFKASDSKMWKAVATASGTSRCVAMAAADISADASGLFLLQGFLADNGSFPSYTIGGAIYTPEAETSSENVPEQTAPDSDGDFVQVIGWAVTANSVYFNPSNDIIEHA